jgi:dolichyl-diphosphooligosaccharide--protein glycosyltransferase
MTDTERVEEATRSFLDEDPENEEVVAALLDHERSAGAWEFDDAPVDSGRFGELVSRSFVEGTDDGAYRFADRDAVASVVDGTADTGTAEGDGVGLSLDLAVPAVDRRATGALLGALLVVVAARSLFYRAVFQSGYIVSPANDPYFYRYWQARLLEESSGAADLGTFATVGELTRIRPLTHALNWWFADLLGGEGGASLVAALQPIVATLLLAVALYALALALTADHRIAVGAVLLLALTPVHAVYTALGFLEHRPYQYLWLGTMAVSLGWLAVDLTRRYRAGDSNPAFAHARAPKSWAVAGLLAVSVAAMAHTWGGSPLSFVPVAAYIGFRVVADCRERIDPLLANVPAIAGIGVGSLLALAIHLRWDWHEAIAATVPVVVAVGAVAVAVLGTLWYRLGLRPAGLLAVEGVLAVVGTALFRRFRPEDVARLQERSDALFNRETAIETASLFATDQAIIFGPLSQIGIGFYLGLVPFGFATYYVAREYDPAWLVTVCFTWFWLVLAAIQVRFAAQFAILCALFGSVGLVSLLGAMDLARPPNPFERTPLEGPSLGIPGNRTVAAYLVGAVAVALLINLIFVPSLLAQTQYSGEQVEAMTAVDDHAEELNRSYPGNYVLSEWGDVRMYNYFVNGESSGYSYARANYESFITDSGPDGYYGQFSGRVGYVVLTELDAPAGTVQAELFDDLGAGNDSVAHYQLLYAGEEVRAFAVVPGAQIRVEREAGENVTARADIEAAGESFEYQRTATANGNGVATVRVAYPGEYDLGGETVTVNETAVYEGATVTTGGE